jgi:hypothetical protein
LHRIASAAAASASNRISIDLSASNHNNIESVASSNHISSTSNLESTAAAASNPQQQHRIHSSIESAPAAAATAANRISIKSASAYHQHQHRITSASNAQHTISIIIKSYQQQQQHHHCISNSNIESAAAAIHHSFPIHKNLYQRPQQTSTRWAIGIPPSMNHDPYKHTTLGQPKFQHHTNPYYNNTNTNTLDLGHPAVKRRFCQLYILLLKAPKARITARQYMDHTCNMLQMIKTMKGIFWSVKNGDISIAIGAFADMDRLPDFDEIVAHPAFLFPQKIPVDEDTILPYFPNLVVAVSGEFNATPFVMAHNIPFHELQARVALHIWPHLSPHQSDPYDPVCLPWRTVYFTV